MDGHPRSIRWLPHPLHFLPLLPYSLRHVSSGHTTPGGGHLPLHRPPRRGRQLDVLLRPPLPPRLHLLPHLRHPASLQRRPLSPHQPSKVHPLDLQLRRDYLSLRRSPRYPRRRRPVVFFFFLRRRILPHARRFRDIRAHPLFNAV